MRQPAHFLLINGSRDDYWHEMLKQVLAPLGTLHIGTEERTLSLVQTYAYDLLIIDATIVENAPLVVARILVQQPDARIIVVTASPTWRRAREVFQAGAMDYIRKSLDRREILSAVRVVLDKTAPPANK